MLYQVYRENDKTKNKGALLNDKIGQVNIGNHLDEVDVECRKSRWVADAELEWTGRRSLVQVLGGLGDRSHHRLYTD